MSADPMPRKVSATKTTGKAGGVKGKPQQRQARASVEPAGGVTLSPSEEAFAVLVATGSSQVAALREAFPASRAWKSSSQYVEACRVAQRPNIVLRISQLRTDAAKANNVDADRVLGEIAAVVFADVRELVDHTRRCCRHCWGLGHGFQRDDEEMRADRATHESRRHARLMKDLPDPGEFDQEGGTGFDPSAGPNPSCPSCKGRGVLRVTIADTDTFSPEARAAYAGIEQGRDGVKLRLHDKMPALNMLGRATGILDPDNAEVSVTVVPFDHTLHDRLWEEKKAEIEAEKQAMLARARRLNEGLDDQSR